MERSFLHIRKVLLIRVCKRSHGLFPIPEIIANGDIELAADAVSVKNEFLLKATGKDSKARRKAMKKDVK